MSKAINLFILFVCMVCCCLGFAACGNDEPGDEYYVRYSVGIQPGSDVFISYLDVDGERIIQGMHNEGKVEVTVGPVRKGFESGLAASVGGHAAEWSAIDVARGSEPFVQRVYVPNAVSVKYIVGE